MGKRLILVLPFVVAGCGNGDDGDGGVRDAGPPRDAGSMRDAGPTRDAGPARDAGTRDGGPSTIATAFDGYWRMTSWTVGTGTAAVVTTRMPGPEQVMSDFHITATDRFSSVLDGKNLFLSDGLLAALSTVTASIEIEPERWVVTPGDEEQVFTFVLDGDVVTLDLDEADPRNVGTTEDTPRAITLARQPAPLGRHRGDWSLRRIRFPTGETVTATDCPFLGDGAYGRLSLDLSIDELDLLEMTFEVVFYRDDTCTTPNGGGTVDEFRGAVEENGDRLDQWMIQDNAERVSVEWTADHTVVDTMMLTRVACVPEPVCQVEVPLSIIFAR
jgi:hypothetical protein